jgi:hypothetical protein
MMLVNTSMGNVRMKINALYPVLLNGKPPRKRTTMLAVVAREAQIDIPELSHDDAPIAFVVHDKSLPSPIDSDGLPLRWHGGILYRPTETTAASLAADLVRPLRASPYYKEQLARMRKEIADHPQALRWPENIHSLLSTNADLHPEVVARCIEESPTFVPEEGEEAKTEQWFSIFNAALDGLVVIDGQIWSPSPEPAYAVTTQGHGSVFIHLPKIYSHHANYSAAPDRFITESFHLFPAARYDDAVAFAEGIADSAGRSRSMQIPAYQRIEIRLEEAATYDFDRLELDRFARLLVADVFRRFERFPTGIADFFKSVPSEVVQAALRVRDMTAGNPLDAVAPDLDEAVFALVDILKNNVHPDHGPYHYFDMVEIQRHLDRWDNRPLSLDDGFSVLSPE